MKHAPMGPVKAKDPKSQAHPMSQRCTATSKAKGIQCGRTAILGGTVCRYHGGAAPQVKAKAAERMKALAPTAVTTLQTLMAREEYPTVQLGAAKYVYDQAEGTAIERHEQQHSGTIVFRHELAE